MNSQATWLAVNVTVYAANLISLTANRTSSGVKGIALMAFFRALKRKEIRLSRVPRASEDKISQAPEHFQSNLGVNILFTA
ncbi:hypothetical protein [Sinomicrobium sp. M5D2P9]